MFDSQASDPSADDPWKGGAGRPPIRSPKETVVHGDPEDNHPPWGFEIEGEDIYYYFGNRVVKSVASNGREVAVKVKPVRGFKRSEASMQQFANDTGKLKAPKVIGCYKMYGRYDKVAVLVSDFVQGQPLHVAWPDLSNAQRQSVKAQIHEQLQKMRSYTSPTAGRVDGQPMENFYEVIPASIAHNDFGPFRSMQEFDDWCLERVRRLHGSISHTLWKYRLSKIRAKGSNKFVLTHGDLSPSNFMVKDGDLLGIIDWEYSGFLPEEVEYFTLNSKWKRKDQWWLNIVNPMLAPGSDKLLKFHELVIDKGFVGPCG